MMDTRFVDKILAGESKVLEFKEILPASEKIAKTVVAFSNTSGGRLIIGVDNDRNIKGIDPGIDIFELQDKVASIVYELCYPNILPEFYTTNVDGKLLFVIEVYRGNLLPYYLKKEGRNQGTYVRIGSSNRKADVETIIDLERQRANRGFDEEVCYDVSLESLDLNPLRVRFEERGKVLDLEKLKNLRLVKEEHGHVYPTQALLIVLGLRENATVKCARFKGKTMEYFIDKKEFSGDLFTQLDHVEMFMKNHLHLAGIIKGLQREDRYEIPMEVIREVLLNAYVHRDYINLGRDIKVGIYDDIVNVVSPGGFPSSITLDDVLAGRSEARNKVLAKIFKELNYIEQWGSGIKRIFTWCEEAGIAKPSITEKGDFVDVELYRENEGVQESVHVQEKDAKSVQENVRDSVRVQENDVKSVQESVREDKRKQRQLIILKYCSEFRTSKEILGRLNIVNHSKNRKLYITGLVNKGLLARTNPSNPKARNQKYITTEAGKLFIEREDDNGRKTR